MKRGASAGSRRAFLISRTQTFSTASPTTVAGQTASRRASLVRRSPGRSTRHCRTAKALGVRRIVFVPRHRHALVTSSLNDAKRSWRAGGNVDLNALTRLLPTPYVQDPLTTHANTTPAPEWSESGFPGRPPRTRGQPRERLTENLRLRHAPVTGRPHSGGGREVVSAMRLGRDGEQEAGLCKAGGRADAECS